MIRISQVEQQVSRQNCKVYRFNLQALVATKVQFWPKVSAALWDHHTAGQSNISSSQHFMMQQQRVLQIRSKVP